MWDCPHESLLALDSQMQQTKKTKTPFFPLTHASLCVFLFFFQIADIAGFSPLLWQTTTTSSVPKGKCLNTFVSPVNDSSTLIWRRWHLYSSAGVFIFSCKSDSFNNTEKFVTEMPTCDVPLLWPCCLLVIGVEVKGPPLPCSNVTNLHLVHLDRIPPPLGNLSVAPVWFSHPKDFQSTPT